MKIDIYFRGRSRQLKIYSGCFGYGNDEYDQVKLLSMTPDGSWAVNEWDTFFAHGKIALINSWVALATFLFFSCSWYQQSLWSAFIITIRLSEARSGSVHINFYLGVLRKIDLLTRKSPQLQKFIIKSKIPIWKESFQVVFSIHIDWVEFYL